MNLFDVHNWVEIDKKLYFKTYFGMSGTYCYSLTNGELTDLCYKEDVYKQTNPSYFRTLSYGKKAIFLPYWFGHKIAIYDTEKDNMVFYEVKGTNYRSGVIYDSKLYAISEQINTSEGILVMDMRNFEISYPYDTNAVSANMFGNGCVYGEWYYINCQEEDAILRINLGSYEIEKICLPKLGIKYGTVMITNDKCFLTGDSNCIVIWDLNDKVKKIGLPDNVNINSFIPWKQMFSDVTLVGNDLYYAPLAYQAFVKLNVETMELEILYNMKLENALTWGIKKYGNNLCLTIVDSKNEVKDVCRFDLDAQKIDNENILDMHLFPKLSLCKYTMMEYSKYALGHFIGNICSLDKK